MQEQLEYVQNDSKQIATLQEENRLKTNALEEVKEQVKVQRKYYASTIEDYKEIMMNQEQMIQDYKYQIDLYKAQVAGSNNDDDSQRQFQFNPWNDDESKNPSSTSEEEEEEDIESLYIPSRSQFSTPPFTACWNNFMKKKPKMKWNQWTPKFTEKASSDSSSCGNKSDSVVADQISSEINSCKEENKMLKDQVQKLMDALNSRFSMTDF